MQHIGMMGGGEAASIEVASAPVRLIDRNPNIKYVRFTNVGDAYVYLTPSNKGPESVKVKAGIVLAPKGEYGSFYELNHTNFFRSDIWAISESQSTVAVLVGL